MPRNIPEHPELLVISDTGMFRRGNDVYAFGPVVREFEAMDGFKSIRWIGYNRPDQSENNSYVKIIKKTIQTKALNKTGGKSWVSKLFILSQYHNYFITVLREIYRHEFIHVRAPSNPAVIAIFLSYFFPKKQFWFKYAGDWIGKTAPFYELQRDWLMKLNNNSKVTVNGNWSEQPKNIIGFENPCLDEADRAKGQECIDKKNTLTRINYCFVGGLNENKGCLILLQALEGIKLPGKTIAFHIVGEGSLKKRLERMASQLEIPIVFHGALAKDEVISIYESCHFIVLPSKSEGFPKVIGEAMNYGCLPIVSDISCIGQYIHHKTNGLLIKEITTGGISKALKESFGISQKEFEKSIRLNYSLSSKFTYEYYNKRIMEEIFSI